MKPLRSAIRPIYRLLIPTIRWLVFSLGFSIFSWLPIGFSSSRPVLALLRFCWGNPWAADTEYLRSMISIVSSARGTVVECGSGLTTLILTLIVKDKNREVYVLEHDRVWYQQVRDYVYRRSVGNVHIHWTPLRDYGTFHWYDLTGIQLPENIDVVICDGPPGSTYGGRYGALPILSSKLNSSYSVLLDDAGRAEEKAIISQWCREFGLSVEVSDSEKPFALLSLGSIAKDTIGTGIRTLDRETPDLIKTGRCLKERF